ncbi:hypothetical protein LXL04_032444 [Taraxacum kok-saghyz]
MQRSSSRLKKLRTRTPNTVESAVMLDEDDDFVNPEWLTIDFGKQKLDSTENLGVDVAQNDEELVDKEFADEELSLEAGLKKFPNSAILHEWKLKKKELFHEPHDDEVANETSETETESDNESNDNEVEDGDEDVGVSHHSPAAGASHHSPVAFETPQPVREEELTFTQVLDQPGVAEEVYAMVDQTEEASLKKKQKEQEKEQEKEKEKEEVVAEQRPKRNVKVSKMICSPYMERIAKIKDRVKAYELVLCNSIFASKRDTKEKVWENDMGDVLYQSDVYTFKSNFYINWRIINCWISIMNARECLKSNESPARLFLHSDCMLIFPIINQGKYYMLCFDLKKPSYVLIDHIVRMGTTANRYGPIPLTLHKFFCYYLKSQRHPSLKTLSKMEANIQNLPWSVIKSGDNCGLYLMRHMECYMGEREGMWETGLTGKEMIDSAAFLGLRYKYMAAIFTLVINKFKEMIFRNLKQNFLTEFFIQKLCIQGLYFLQNIWYWDLLRTHIFPRTRELPQFPISPKPLFTDFGTLQNKNFFATGLKIERFLAPEVGFSKKLTLGSFENSYIPENPRTPPISYISQTVILFKKPNSGLFKTIYMYKIICDFILITCVKSYMFFSMKNKWSRFVLAFSNSIISQDLFRTHIFPRTPKPLTFSKNRLRGAKNRSNLRPVAKKNPKKQLFFFQKLCICAKIFFVYMCINLYNTYLKGFVKKNLKKNAKKNSCIYAKIKKKSCTYAKVKKNIRILMILNVLKSPKVGFFERNNGLGDIGNWGSSRVLGNI